MDAQLMARNQKFNRPIQSPVRNEPPEKERIPNFELLDEEAKERLRGEAMAKIEAREIAAAEKAFLDAEIERLDRERHPEVHEPMVEVELDGLALYADRITLDGKIFWFGQKYTVKQSVAAVFEEVMQRTRRHEGELRSGDNYSNFYKQQRNGAWNQKQAGVGKTFSVGTGARTGF